MNRGKQELAPQSADCRSGASGLVWPISCIDALRGIAALSVLLNHFGEQEIDLTVSIAGRVVRDLGTDGVTVFFVLSGFCIHGATLNGQRNGRTVNWSEYFQRRFLRIYPALVVSVFLGYWVGKFVTTDLIRVPSIWTCIEHLSLISNFDAKNRCNINGVVWSAVVECFFYLLYPAYLAMRRRWSLTCTLLIITGCGYAYIAAATFLTTQGDMRVMWQFTFPALWWKWCLGAGLAELYFGRKIVPNRRTGSIIAFGALILSLSPAFMPHFAVIQFNRFVLTWLLALFVFCLCQSNFSHVKSSMLAWLGQISYSIYLFHPFSLVVLLFVPSWPWSAKLGLAVAVTLTLASLGFYAVERPFLKLRKALVATGSAPAKIRLLSSIKQEMG